MARTITTHHFDHEYLDQTRDRHLGMLQLWDRVDTWRIRGKEEMMKMVNTKVTVSGVAASRMYLFGWSRNLSTKSINCPYSNCPRLAGELLLIVTLRTVLLDRRLVVMN